MLSDARPDYSRWSSDLRMELSVAAAMGHIQTFIEPQVIITNHGSREDGFFIKSIRAKASEIGKSLIELPLDATENLMWLTRLDSGSLAGKMAHSCSLSILTSFLAWQTVYVDLVIHAPPKSSGSLIRLLKSIEAADYFGSRRPHLTIELPAEIDRPTLEFLENLVWPPLDGSGGSHASQVTLRHRLPRYGFTAEEASTHFIESFYPARPKDSHVLLISPQVELSPMYYHYVMYNLLRYKYAAYARLTDASKSLMGFSLELPSVYLNGSAGLQPPILEPLSNGLEFVPQERTPFLWQAPNSNAALYFGDKWVELHSFLSARNSIRDPQFPKDYKPPSRNKIVSEHYPSWMEYVQELMRARGYSLLYPYIPARSHAVVTVHNELFQLPEEYSPARHRSSLNPTPSLNAHGPFIVNSSSISPGLTVHEESPLLTSNLLTWLSESGRSSLPDLISLPILSYDGNLTSPSLSESNAEAFANDFRREIGRCGANEPLAHNHMSAEDLFCYPKLREYGLIDPMEEEDNDKGISTGTVVGNPMEIPSEQVQEEAKMLATEGENVQREVADAVKLGKDDVQTEASKLMQKSGQDIVAEGSKADLRLATGGKIETLDNKITSKDANLKMDEHIIKEDSINDGSIDFKLAINDDEKSAKKEAVEAMTTRVNQPAIKQDAAGDLDLQGLQAGLDSTKGTSTELSPAQNRPSASITVDTAFVRPAVRHRGW